MQPPFDRQSVLIRLCNRMWTITVDWGMACRTQQILLSHCNQLTTIGTVQWRMPGTDRHLAYSYAVKNAHDPYTLDFWRVRIRPCSVWPMTKWLNYSWSRIVLGNVLLKFQYRLMRCQYWSPLFRWIWIRMPQFAWDPFGASDARFLTTTVLLSRQRMLFEISPKEDFLQRCHCDPSRSEEPITSKLLAKMRIYISHDCKSWLIFCDCWKAWAYLEEIMHYECCFLQSHAFGHSCIGKDTVRNCANKCPAGTASKGVQHFALKSAVLALLMDFIAGLTLIVQMEWRNY